MGTSYFDHTVLVLTSEFGRTIHGDGVCQGSVLMRMLRNHKGVP